jgi:hypothetical protein
MKYLCMCLVTVVIDFALKVISPAQCCWLTAVIQATGEAEIRMITVQK